MTHLNLWLELQGKKSTKPSPNLEEENSIHPSIAILATQLTRATTRADIERLKEWSTADEWTAAQQLLAPDQKTQLLAIWNQPG